MTKTKIALYVALIFLAGGVAGAGVRSIWKATPPAPPPVRNREDFANHIFNRLKERLALTPDQIVQIEPIFRKGFEEVRAIQDRSVKEVDAAVKRNHEAMASVLTDEQRLKLEEWDRAREKAFRDRKNRHRSGGGKPEESAGSSKPN